MGRFELERGPSGSKRGMEIAGDESRGEIKRIKYTATGMRKEMSRSLRVSQKKRNSETFVF